MKAIKIFAVVAAAALMLSCGSQSKVKVEGAELPSAELVDSVSYLMGINFASFIKGNGFGDSLNDLNMAELKRGMKEFMEAEGDVQDPDFVNQFDIDPNMMNMVFNEFIQKKMAYKAALNLATEKEFLAKNAKRADVKTTASGLQYTIIADGAAEKIASQDTVWVNYKGTLLDGTVFDQNDSIMFVANRVIKGWTEGLGLIGEGGKAVLYIPAELAYGERGNRGIEPNSTLVFDVEVLKVGKYAPAK